MADNQETKHKKPLFIFDFDETIIDVDSDRYVFEKLSPKLRQKMNELIPTVQFTDLVDQLLGELVKDEGITRDQIEKALQSALLPEPMLQLLHLLQPPKTHRPIIISNANTFYIDTILKYYDWAHESSDIATSKLFHHVITNPAHFDPEDPHRLRVKRLHPHDAPPLNCIHNCGVNMCKGKEVQNIWTGKSGKVSMSEVSCTVYVGDGNNDYCPATLLNENDYLLARTGRGLERRIKEQGNIKAKVIYWDTHDEVFKWVRGFLESLSTIEE